MASRKSVRSADLSVCTRLATKARAVRRRSRDLLIATARFAVEAIEQRVLLTGTPALGVNFPVGINFASGYGTVFNVNPTDTAGAYPMMNWNNETGATGSSALVVDSSGAGTTLGVQWQADTTYSSANFDAFAGAGDQALMAGYLDDFATPAANGNGGARATTGALTSGTIDGTGELVTGLNLAAYDVVVYAQSGGTFRNFSITVTGTAASTQMVNGIPGPVSQYVVGENVLVFPDVAPSNHNILFTPDNASATDDTEGLELLPIATAAPTAVTLTGTYDAANAAADLTWTGGGSNALLYQVQRSNSANGPWTTVSESLPSATTAADNLPFVGPSYYYRLVSLNSFNGGSTAASNVVGPFQAPAGSGVEAHYFPQSFWQGQPTLEQFPTTANVNFPGGTPDPSIRNFNNSMVFTGKIKANEHGFYTFVSNSDDDGYLYVDGVLVSADPGPHGQRDALSTRVPDTVFPISLAANSTHDFVFLVNQAGDGEGAHIEWVTPSAAAANPAATPVSIPSTNLTSAIGTPSQPKALHVTGISGSNAVDFTFTSDNNAVFQYLLQRSDDGGNNWVTVAQRDPAGAFSGGLNTNIGIEDATVLPGTTYQYRVLGMNFDYTGTPSAPFTFTTGPAQGGGVELRYYNGEIASAQDSQDPHNFATAALPSEFLFLNGMSGYGHYNGSPDARLSPNIPWIHRYSFATVWTGKVLTDGAGVYTFITNTSDDGYLFVNGVLVSSDPGTHALRNATNLTPITLAANTAYSFVLIEQEVNNGISATAPAGVSVSWIEPGRLAAPIQEGEPGLGGLESLMSTPDKQTSDASGHITETAGQSAAGNLTATGATSGSGVTLTWTDQGLSQLWFEVQRATSAGGPFTTVGTAGFNATTFTDHSATVGAQYFYRVRGMNFDAAGPFSNAANAIATTASQTINGTAGNDTITLKVDSTDPTKDDVWINAPTTGTPTTAVSNGQTIVVNGLGGTDTLLLDSSNGNPVPSGAAGTVLRLNSGTGSFTLGGTLPTIDATHVVDVGTSTVNIPYSGTSILPAVQSDLKNGFVESTDAAGTGGKFAGADIDTGSQIKLQYAVIGDTNVDGHVNFTDLLALAQHYGNTGVDWSKGDLNYDGTVNFTDLLALAQHYGQTAAAAATAPLAAASSPLSADTLSSVLKKKARHR